MLTFDKFCQYVQYERTGERTRASRHPVSFTKEKRKKNMHIYKRWKSVFPVFLSQYVRTNIPSKRVSRLHFSLFNSCNFFCSPRPLSIFHSTIELTIINLKLWDKSAWTFVKEERKKKLTNTPGGYIFIRLGTRVGNDARICGVGHVSCRCADAFAQVESARVNWSYQY